MGWTVIKIDEHGREEKKLADEFEIINFDNLDLGQFKLIKYLNPYGDLTFGITQFDDLIEDLIRLEKLGQVKSNQMTELRGLIKDCKDTVHSYLKFYGD